MQFGGLRGADWGIGRERQGMKWRRKKYCLRGSVNHAWTDVTRNVERARATSKAYSKNGETSDEEGANYSEC